MDQLSREFLTYLSEYITENKKTRMEEVLAQRTRHLTVVLEDIFEDPSQIYEIEFDGDDDLISFDDLESSCID